MSIPVMIVPPSLCVCECRVPGREREERKAIHSRFYWLHGSKFTSRVIRGRGLGRHPDPEEAESETLVGTHPSVKRILVMGRIILLSQQKLTLVIVMERTLLKTSDFPQNRTKVTSVNLMFIL